MSITYGRLSLTRLELSIRSPRPPVASCLAALLLAAVGAPRSVVAQSATPAPSPGDETRSTDDRDLLDVLGLRRDSGRSGPKQDELVFLAVPAFGANPTVGVALGGAVTGGIALGPPQDTIMSSFSVSVMASTKKQVMASAKSVVLTSGNDWELLGDWRLYSFSEPTYGLGTGTTPVSSGFVLNGMDTAALPGAQPMKFNYVRLYETVFRRVAGPIYLGLGYHLDLHSKIRDLTLDTGASPPVITSDYAYSTHEGLDPTHDALSGVSVDALYESRDHILDPYRGLYLQLSYCTNPTWLGSSRASSTVYGELRAYIPLSADRPRHLLSLWVIAEGVTSGAVPYLDLPAIGYDTRGRSGRGYAAGRFRGTALTYLEVEYRFPLMSSGVLGGVVFGNATTTSRPPANEPALGVSDRGVPLFDSVKPAGGVGLRIMADRLARMNVVIDYAMGVGGSSGLYLTMGETF